MTKISGFSFVHNGIEGGYPFVEAIQVVRPYVDDIVVVDMESTDGTRKVLEKLDVRILDGRWGDQAGVTLRDAHSKHIECSGDVVIHFEADEVYDPRLLQAITCLLKDGVTDITVHRLQLEQNFQRCRWYPEPVHRVFSRLSSTRKKGHTTNRHDLAHVLSPEYGLLWDVTNCFRDNWFQRVENQAQLWHGNPTYIMTPVHVLHVPEVDYETAKKKLGEKHWTWKTSPFDLPKNLLPLVGQTRYVPKLD